VPAFRFQCHPAGNHPLTAMAKRICLVCYDWYTGEEISGVFSYDSESHVLGRLVGGDEVWEQRRLRGFRLGVSHDRVAGHQAEV